MMTMVGELFAFSFWLFAPHKVMLNLFQHLTVFSEEIPNRVRDDIMVNTY